MPASRSLPASIRVALTAAVLAATGATVASAERLNQRTPLVTPMGAGSTMTTYWVDEPEGFRVFVTVESVRPGAAGREDPRATVRSSIVLRPGQTQTIAMFDPDGVAPPSVIRVRRLGERIEVQTGLEPASSTDRRKEGS